MLLNIGPLTINLPLPILIHATLLLLAGLSLLLRPTSSRPTALYGLATTGLGLSYLLTAYTPIEENQFLYASVTARIVLGALAGVKVAVEDWRGARGRGGEDKERKGSEFEERNALLVVAVYDGLGGVVLGWYLGSLALDVDAARAVRESAAPALPSLSPHGTSPFAGVALAHSPTDDEFDPAAGGGLRRSPSVATLGKARAVGGTPVGGYHKPFRAVDDLVKSPSSPEGLGARDEVDARYASFRLKSQSVSSLAGSRQASIHSIASLYPSPTALPSPNSLPLPKSASLPNVRRSHKVPPTFNILLCGASETGKTSFARTLLSTVVLASAAAGPTSSSGSTTTIPHSHSGTHLGDLAKISSFGLSKHGGVRTTTKTQHVSVDVVEKERNNERFTLTVVDTPGLDIPMGPGRVGDELEVERQLAGVLRNVEARFDDTLQAESNLFRHSHRTHDHHIHLCIYFLHPSSITSHSSRSSRPSSSQYDSPEIPRRHKISRTGGYRKALSSPALARPGVNGSGEPVEEGREEEEGEESDEDEVGMSGVDLRCIRRLQRRVNVLPIIARSDELTTSQLAKLKAIVKRDLKNHDLGFATFGSNTNGDPGAAGGDTARSRELVEDVEGEKEERGRGRSMSPVGSAGAGKRKSGGSTKSASGKTNGGEVDATIPPSTSEAGHEEKDLPDPSPVDPTTIDPSDFPEPVKLIRIRSTSRHARRGSSRSRTVEVFDHEPTDGEDAKVEMLLPFAVVAPEWDGKEAVVDGEAERKEGEKSFKREFRWGALDVLNPEHCDFTPLRKALLGTQMRHLKESTKLDKYEPFRTQRLLAIRGTGTLRDQNLLKELSAI